MHLVVHAAVDKTEVFRVADFVEAARIVAADKIQDRGRTERVVVAARTCVDAVVQTLKNESEHEHKEEEQPN